MSQTPLPIHVLTDGQVTLRPHREGDLDRILERCVDPVTVRFTTVPTPYTREMAAEYLADLGPSPERISWAIEHEGVYAGTIDLRRMAVDAGGGDLGFVTHPAARGRGVMSAAVGLVLGHAFDDLGWQLVRWKAHAGNWASLKAVWRNGFPAPVAVPALIIERGVPHDGWISTIWRDDPRRPAESWDEVRARLA
jgi:RimJ/RimL family protein N-acetyltransferase